MLAGSTEGAVGRGQHCHTAGGGPGWPTLQLSPSCPKAGGSWGGGEGKVMARLGDTLPCWGLGAWRAEWCNAPRASLGLLGTGWMVPFPRECGGTCTSACSAICSGCVGGQLRGPRPCASALDGPQVLGLLQPPRRHWCLPGPCLALDMLGEQCCWRCPAPCPTAGRVESQDGGPRPSAAPAPFSPHHNTWEQRRQTPIPRAALPERKPFPESWSRSGLRRGCQQRREWLRFVSGALPVLGCPMSGRTPLWSSAPPPPSTIAAPTAPHAQTTHVTQVYKAHWLKETELSEKINPTTRHV